MCTFVCLLPCLLSCPLSDPSLSCLSCMRLSILGLAALLFFSLVFPHLAFFSLQSCPATTRLVITLISCNAVGRASRFFQPVGFFFFFFFLILYFLTANCIIFYVLCHDVLLPLCLLYIYSYLFYCFMSEPTVSFWYALLVSRVGKYD